MFIIALIACFSTSIRANSTHESDMRRTNQVVLISDQGVNITQRDLDRFWSKVEKNGPLPDQQNPHYSGLEKCWTWKVGFFDSGYGSFWLDGIDRLAHRVSFVIAHGSHPSKGSACHKCDNPACVNPSHLFDGDHQDNVDDKVRKGRQPTGEASGPRKHPERMARGDKNGSRLYPERLRRGDNHPLRLNPERAARGDRNGSRLYPERLKRGDDHPARKNPENLSPGEEHYCAVLTSEKVREIRSLRSNGGTFRGIARQFGVSRDCIKAVVKRQTWKHVI